MIDGRYKIGGCCTCCNEHCFEVKQVWADHERYPGEPKRFGAPLPGAVRISFLLLDGKRCELTFCERCANALAAEHYTPIWQKVLRSWQRELDKDHPGEPRPSWFVESFSNAILSEMGRTPWQEVAA